MNIAAASGSRRSRFAARQEDLAKTVDRPHAVSYVSGQVAADGQSVVLRVETAEDEPIDLAVAMPDLQYLTTLLLLLISPDGQAILAKYGFSAPTQP